MTEVHFGELASVDLRRAWPNEARSFTSWLADNLDKLAEVIGIPLDLESREVDVGRFAADLLARKPAGRQLGADRESTGRVRPFPSGPNPDLPSRAGSEDDHLDRERVR